MKPIVNLLKSKTYVLTAVISLVLVPFAYATTENFPASLIIGSSSTASLSTSTLLFSSSSLQSLKPAPEITFGTEEKVRKGKVVAKYYDSFKFNTGSTTMIVLYEATSSYYTGEGEQITADDISPGAWVYVFGYIKSDKTAMSATKVITANRVKFWTLRH